MERTLMRIPAGLLALAAALLSAPAAARADDALALRLGVESDLLVVTARLEGGFDAETRRSIDDGLPITIRYTTEIWRKRRLWFDKQLDSRVRTFRVRFDPGERLYSVTGSGPRRRETFRSLDAALDRLSPRTLDVLPHDQLEERHEYYVAVELAVRPLTLEEFRELDGWISGRIRGDGDEDPEAAPSEEGEGGVSGAVFGFLLDLAGFGDKIHASQTPPFRPSVLFLSPPPPRTPPGP